MYEHTSVRDKSNRRRRVAGDVGRRRLLARPRVVVGPLGAAELCLARAAAARRGGGHRHGRERLGHGAAGVARRRVRDGAAALHVGGAAATD